MTSRIGRRLRWHPLSVDARLLAHALRNGLWRWLSPAVRTGVDQQHVRTWSTSLPDRTCSPDIVSHLRHAGLRVQEGGNAFYLPPQPGLAGVLGAAVHHYPPGSGFKILRDFRGLDEAHYLHPERQTRLRRRLIGTPRDQLIAANYLHWLRLGPRVWDVCLLRAGGVPMPAFVVQHVDGRAPDAEECAAFLQRLRTALAETELRISVPNWERNKDFRCPTCNHNLLRDGTGALNYIDFQNFAVRNPRRILESAVDAATPLSALHRHALARHRSGDPGRPARAEGSLASFQTIQRLLGEQGVRVDDRVVLGIGCNAGTRLRQALAAGAWWALGWDEAPGAMQAQAVAIALAFTRLELTAGELDERYDLGASIPAWLAPYLDEALVFVLAGHRPGVLPRSLAGLPWRALAYEGQHGESLADVEGRVRRLVRPGLRVVRRMHLPGAESHARPLCLLVREPAAAPAAASAIPP